MKDINKPFVISTVCKADLLGLERELANNKVVPVFKKSDINRLTEADMERLASKLANDYCEQLYWSSLEIIAEYIIEQNKREARFIRAKH
ncbi:MAG: hypothetical protein IM631_12170 [Cytophagales bacterium]|jgi:hypothetical protein|nr:hypothetical protein [Cytophagales bacterium]MCA6372126.1 hypothetical protein [Cytophagales bacterium]MCA6382270.1 hypothetical protein [Cytophagales bacterium]